MTEQNPHEHENTNVNGVFTHTPFVLKTVPILASKVLFLIFSFYWIYRAIILHASVLFYAMGLSFLLWSIISLAWPFYTYKKTHVSISGSHIHYHAPLFNREISLHSIISCNSYKSIFDKRHHSSRIDITYEKMENNNAIEDYLEIWGLIDHREFEDRIKSCMKKEPTKE